MGDVIFLGMMVLVHLISAGVLVFNDGDRDLSQYFLIVFNIWLAAGFVRYGK